MKNAWRHSAAGIAIAVVLAAPAAAGETYLVAAGRSPIPQPGEVFDEPIPARRLVPAQPAPGGVVSWREAAHYLGRRITVEGRVVSTYNHEGRVCFLNFHRDWQGKFYLTMFDDVFEQLPAPPENYFRGRVVRATGKVIRYEGRANMEIHDVSQIERLDDPAD